MSPERWQQIDQLFEAALDQPVPERAAFLAQACGNDVELRREVEALLQSDEEAQGFIETPVASLAGKALAQVHALSQTNAEADAQTRKMIGRKVGHYKILALLGAGGMGEVYLADDIQLGRKVALKLLPPRFTSDAERLRRFEQEGRTASALNHPNILTIHASGRTAAAHGGTYYIVTEFIEGWTLRQQMAGGRMELREAIDVALQVASALVAAHAASIVHRDIKPENIMLRPDGYVKVLDFGLAKLAEQRLEPPAPDAPTKGNTTPGLIMGTARYMSPEQARGQQVDARTDIFSLGVVLYEMVTGKSPFAGATMADTIAAILERDPLPLTPSAAPGLEQILRKALRKDSTERYQSSQEMLADLSDLKQELAFTARLEQTQAPQAYPNPHSDSEAASQKPELVDTSPVAALATSAGDTAFTSQLFLNEIKRHKRGAGVTLAVSLIILATTAFGLYRYIIVPTEGPNPAMRIVPFTSYPGEESLATFSPDGNQIAFVWDGGKENQPNEDIYVKLLDTGAPLRLTTDPAPDHSPAWSPDGRNIAFLRWSRADRTYGLYLVPALGGAERKLLEGMAEEPGLNWSPDGEMLALNTKNTPSEPDHIFLLQVKTGEQRRMTFPPAEFSGDTYPSFSPDGQTLAFVRWTSSGAADLFLVPLSGGEAKQLTFDKRTIRGLAWTANGSEIIFASERRGVSSLWRISVAGGEPKNVQAVGPGVQFPAISHRGNRLAYRQIINDANIWQMELTNPASHRSEPVRLIASTFEDNSPQYSLDGNSILFGSTRSGSFEIWSSKADGTYPFQLTHLEGPLTGTPRWSPDGKQVAFDSRVEGNADIFLVNATGETPRRFIGGPAEEVLPSWSRDGRWLYYCTNSSGSREIWKMPLAGGQPQQFTKQGGFEGFESFDGKFFYFTKRSRETGIWRIPVEGGAESLVLPDDRKIYRRNWTLTKRGIYFGADRRTIEFFSFATGKITPVASTPKNLTGAVPSLAVDPTERWLLYTLNEQEGSDIMLLEKFH